MAQNDASCDHISFDVLIIGGGPAGLSAAIALKQKAPHLTIALLEKAANIGDHILSGAILDISALKALIPDFMNDPSCPVKLAIKSEEWRWLTEHKSYKIPPALLPKSAHNKGNFIISLANLCRWLARRAEQLGVEIYSGFCAQDILLNDKNQVIGILSGEMGRRKNGEKGSNFIPAMEIRAKYSLIAEGARGHIAKKIIKYFALNKNASAQKYALGLKELWQIDPSLHRMGHVSHMLGWPLQNKAGGGGFLYHSENNQLALGLIIHLDYKNPTLSPYQELQNFKRHPHIKALLQNGQCIAYGARSISCGGWQSLGQIAFPGGALIGCAAGYLNLARLKGIDNAIYSALAASQAIIEQLSAAPSSSKAKVPNPANKLSPSSALLQINNQYQARILKDLYKARNIKPLMPRFGIKWGVLWARLDLFWQNLFKFSLLGTLNHKEPDYLRLDLAAKQQKLTYPSCDNKICFPMDKALSLAQLSYAKDQPCHLKIISPELHDIERRFFAGASQYYCPAGVYQWIESEKGPLYVINSENCLQCKCCDIKDPNQNINWTCPQGGDGPCYPNM